MTIDEHAEHHSKRQSRLLVSARRTGTKTANATKANGDDKEWRPGGVGCR